MALTEQHLGRIQAFIIGRIMQALYDAEHGRKTDEELRIIRALHRVVISLGVRGSLTVPAPLARADDHTRQAMEQRMALAMEFAWTDLQYIARQWRDHPAYLPEFDLTAPDLPSDESGDT